MDDPDEFENKHVHSVYENISQNFSDTRYKVWSSVKKFIMDIPSTAQVLEVGCGNGKNLKDMKHVSSKVGCDMSPSFVNMVIKEGIECHHANILNLPYQTGGFDYTLCIAVLHHLSTQERREKGLSELIRVTKPGGFILIQVWAMEQPDNSRRKFSAQDSLVSWDNSLERYYHLFVKGELENLVTNKNVNIVESFYEIGNWGVVLKVN